MRPSFRLVVSAASALALALMLSASPALAQLDPLLFLKNQAPNVILVVETGNRMQRDADLTYYDPGRYAKTGALYELVLGLSAGEATSYYRRRYVGLEHINQSGGDKFKGTRIEVVGDLESGYATFYERTRLAVARKSLIQAISDNVTSARFGLIKTRQSNPLIPSPAGNEGPVTIDDLTQQTPTDLSLGKWHVTRPTVTQRNSTTAAQPVLVAADASGANGSVYTLLQKDINVNGALIPAGDDDVNTVDAPIGLMMDDARTEAARLIAADASGCRNTVVVLVVGGAEGTVSPQNLPTKASTFLNVSSRRVPIYVVAIAPEASQVASLQAVAANSGGQYFEVTKAMIEATTAGQAVAEAVRAVNLAVQHTYVPSTTFNTAPTGPLPYGPQSEFQVTSPIVGSVNLKGAGYFDPITGAAATLPDSETDITNPATSAPIPLRSNVMVTTGFALPGFEGRLRALRIYKPVPDTTKPSGYKFTKDGSRLWVSSTPSAASRNIYTVLPGSSTMIKFDTSMVSDLTPYLGVGDPSALIDWVRSQPLGAVIGSTPAFLDPPSLDPPPDATYPQFVTDNKERRSLIFVGANDGMMHALDARSGTEVWAFIPFNLLPKLRALRYGQSMDAFKYFVDSSPKIADVKIGDDWKTYLFFGQGPGGTFYNTLDVTIEHMSDSVSDISTSTSQILNYFSTAGRIKWVWSFPRNTMFNSAIAPYGDVAVGANSYEKSVGETWSDPAIGQVVNEDGPYVMFVGSGYLKRSIELQSNRGGARAGRAFYALDVLTGNVLASRDVGADTFGEEDDSCRAADDCRRVKNALQMDPVATGPSDSRFVSKIYIGDLDGKVWRFDMSMSGTTISMALPVNLFSAGKEYPMFASMATVNVGGSKQYIFVGNGSDLLPSNSVNHSYSLIVLLDNGSSATKTAEILLEPTDGVSPDEKVTAFPAVAGDIVFFSTTSINPAAPCLPFTANLYAFTFTGGAAYDTNNDGKLTTTTTTSGGGGKGKGGSGGASTSEDSTKVYSSAGVRATAPFIVDQHLVFASGGKLDMFGDPDDFNNGVGQAGVRILSWRLVK